MNSFDAYVPDFVPPSTVRPPPSWRGCCTLCRADVLVPIETTRAAPVACKCGRAYYAHEEGVYVIAAHSQSAETESPPPTTRTPPPVARYEFDTLPEVL